MKYAFALIAFFSTMAAFADEPGTCYTCSYFGDNKQGGFESWNTIEGAQRLGLRDCQTHGGRNCRFEECTAYPPTYSYQSCGKMKVAKDQVCSMAWLNGFWKKICDTNMQAIESTITAQATWDNDGRGYPQPPVDGTNCIGATCAQTP